MQTQHMLGSQMYSVWCFSSSVIILGIVLPRIFILLISLTFNLTQKTKHLGCPILSRAVMPGSKMI